MSGAAAGRSEIDDDPRATVLVDSRAFWEAMKADLAEARERAYIQTYSFEGDTVGAALARELLRARTPDVRLLVDSYTRANQNDRWIHTPGTLFDRSFRAELRETRRLVAELRSGGVGVRFGRPLGFLGHRILHRDHKKLLVFDDRVAYVGGLNFSEHNFEWHDFMIRIVDAEVARFLRADFVRSWEGRSAGIARSFPALDLELMLLPGRGNRGFYDRILGLIDGARSSIHVVSPYIGPPFTRRLAAAAERGVDVHFVTPVGNNKPYLRRYLFAEAARARFAVHLFPDRMIHMKCLLIDDRTLVGGSSNFDVLAYHEFPAEIVAVFRSPALVRAFRRQVLDPALEASEPLDPSQAREAGRWARFRSTAPIHLVEVLGRMMNPPGRGGPHGG